MMIIVTLVMVVLLFMLILVAKIMMLPLLSACVVAGVVAALWRTVEPGAEQKKYQALAIGVLVSQLVVLPIAWQSAKHQLFGSPTTGNAQQEGAVQQERTAQREGIVQHAQQERVVQQDRKVQQEEPVQSVEKTIQPVEKTIQQDEETVPKNMDRLSVEALARSPARTLDEFCKTYCADELGWSAAEFTKSSVQDFYQTREPTDLRCDFSEVARDIGGDERHAGSWINEQCNARGLRNCYWSINYGKPRGGRVACIRPAFVPRE
jgi:hypothetical protein